MKMRHCIGAMLLALAIPAFADYPAPKEGDWIVNRFQVPHGRGAACAQASLHDDRRAHRRAGTGVARHHGLGCGHVDARVRRRALRSRPAARCDPLLRDPARRHRHREIHQAFRWIAGEVPALRLRRHGRCAVSIADRAPRREAPAPRHRQFHGRHAGVDVGREASGLQWTSRSPWPRCPRRCRDATG